MCFDKNHRIVVSYNPLKFQATNLKNGDFTAGRCTKSLFPTVLYIVCTVLYIVILEAFPENQN